MDALRRVGNNFFENWQKKSREDKLRDKDFVEMLRGFEAKTLSMYKNAFSMEFAENVAAALAIRRKTVQMTSFIVFKKADGCMLFVNEDEVDDPNVLHGNTGVDSIDATHVLVHGVGEDDLLEILDGVTEKDFVQVELDDVYRALARLEREQPNLTEVYDNAFSEKRLRRLDDFRE